MGEKSRENRDFYRYLNRDRDVAPTNNTEIASEVNMAGFLAMTPLEIAEKTKHSFPTSNGGEQ